jgi:tetratricopeptide (TPR) repeat protein
MVYCYAVVINPKYENALADKGMALGSLGNYTDAIKYFDKTLAIDPSDENALYMIKVLLLKI